MCISRQRLPVPGSSGVSGDTADEGGGPGPTYKSAFARSKFFIRGSTGEFCPVMPRSQCVDPTSRISVADRGHLSHAQERKQWATGPSLWAQVAEAIWSGIDVSNSDGAAWIELLGYDHNLQCAIMTRAGVMAINAPREMAGSIIWTLGQNEGKTAEESNMKRLKTELLKKCTEKTNVLPDAPDIAAEPAPSTLQRKQPT